MHWAGAEVWQNTRESKPIDATDFYVLSSLLTQMILELRESQFRAAASDSLPASVQFNFVDLEGQTRKDRSQSVTKTVTLGILPLAKHSSERNHAPLMLQNVGIEGVAVQC